MNGIWMRYVYDEQGKPEPLGRELKVAGPAGFIEEHRLVYQVREQKIRFPRAVMTTAAHCN
jgi:Txe/YoeB family toxin of Txe-Axe toxin-antitoxin module